MIRVAGVVRLPPAKDAYVIARVRVSVRDITEADGPAATVASVDLPATRAPASGVDLPFAVDVPLNPGRTYAVRAHADREGSGAVDPDDLVSTTAHVIDPAAPPTRLVVPLQPVRA